MYNVSIPITASENLNKEKLLVALKKANADYLFLAISETSLKPEKNEKYFSIIENMIPYFKENGIKVGIWFWSFWLSDFEQEDLKDYVMVNAKGELRSADSPINSNLKVKSGFICPTSDRAVSVMTAFMKRAAECNPDIILLDDDYDYATHMNCIGCYCDRHLKLMSEKIGYNITREELSREVTKGNPNDIRKMWYEIIGSVLEDYAVKLRDAVDSVNPEIRLGLCSVMSLWGTDGTTPEKIVKLLAGSTKPFLRLTGAPYWASPITWSRLQHAIELSRMECAWVEDKNIEILSEGDVYPRPRHKVPASYLEIFDTALRASGATAGIHKYMLDYTSDIDYETGYIDRHIKNLSLYNEIARIFDNKTETGVRVYETMNKITEADFSGIENPHAYSADLFFSRASKMLCQNSVPTSYSVNTGVGIAFGENARHLTKEAFRGGLILDIRAARILMEMGIDVGIKKIGGKLLNNLLYFPKENDRVVTYYGEDSEYEIELKDGAEIVVYSEKDGKRYPDAVHYENADGQKFLIYAFDAAFTDESRYRNYYTQSQLFDSIEWLSGKKMPVKCAGNPDLYIICKKSDEGMAIGLWNIFADEIMKPIIELNRNYTAAEFINCSGILCGDRIELSEIPPYGYAFISLK